MQRISFAPVLSATRSRDSCWITSLLPDLSCDSRAGTVNRLSDTHVRTHRQRQPPVRRSTGTGMGAHPEGAPVVQGTRSWTRPGGRLRRGPPGPPPRLLGLLEDLDQPPPLGGRRRPGLHDLHSVTDAGDLLLVVGLQLACATDD